LPGAAAGEKIDLFEGLCRDEKVNDKKALMSIGKAAKKAGISRQSLQYYLMVGLLEPTEVTSTGRRMFDDEAVERIRLIRKLNESGYPLRAIRELFIEGGNDLKGAQSE
jgi:DNA-binding transcriptional MerR regulator